MAKALSITVTLLEAFGNCQAGEKHDLSADLAQRLIDRGIAERCTGQAEPVKDTIVKTIKPKKK